MITRIANNNKSSNSGKSNNDNRLSPQTAIFAAILLYIRIQQQQTGRGFPLNKTSNQELNMTQWNTEGNFSAYYFTKLLQQQQEMENNKKFRILLLCHKGSLLYALLFREQIWEKTCCACVFFPFPFSKPKFRSHTACVPSLSIFQLFKLFSFSSVAQQGENLISSR